MLNAYLQADAPLVRQVRRTLMRTLTLAALAAVGLAVLSLPAEAVPAGLGAGIAGSSGMLTGVRMRRLHTRRQPMTWVQRRR